MANARIDRTFYDAIVHFENSSEAQDYYYEVMNSVTERNGKKDTVRNQILRTYAMLFCEDMGVKPSQAAGPDEVEQTADRLYIGKPGLDPAHWYRMMYHFPVIDDDNYDRFAALVIADLNAGPLRKAALEGDLMLLVGEKNPLGMTREHRSRQRTRRVDLYHS